MYELLQHNYFSFGSCRTMGLFSVLPFTVLYSKSHQTKPKKYHFYLSPVTLQNLAQKPQEKTLHTISYLYSKSLYIEISD